MARDKCVLAYSGGLDTSVAIQWIRDNHDLDVIALAVDVGQERQDLEFVRQKALRIGAVESIVKDVREEYVERVPEQGAEARTRCTRTSIRCSRRCRVRSSSSTSSRRRTAPGRATSPTAAPARATTRCASRSASPRSTPTSRSLAPVREWDLCTREQEMDYAAERGIPVPTTKASPYSIDDNLWGRAIECGVLEDPWVEPPADIYTMTNDARADACDTPEYVEISFEQGLPVALDGELTCVPRDHPRDERARRAPRLRPHRHDREPPRRREEPRDLRGAGRAHAHPGAQGARGPVPRARPAALQARHRAEVGGARLQRHVVLAAEGGARRLRRDHAEARHGRRASAVLQGIVRGGRAGAARTRSTTTTSRRTTRRTRSTTAPPRASSTCGACPRRCGRASVARPARKARSRRPRPRRAWRCAGTGRRRDRDGGWPKKAWGGRFEGCPRRVRHRFGASLPVDRAMWDADVRGSIAHVRMLAPAGHHAGGGRRGDRGRPRRGARRDRGRHVRVRQRRRGHPHGGRARAHRERIGAVGGRLHTARSRNDQVATDTRLHAKGARDSSSSRARSRCRRRSWPVPTSTSAP